MFDEIAKLAATCFVAAMGLGALWCCCRTKTKGWGPYSTSTLIVVLVVSTTAVLSASGLIPGSILADVFLVALGFAGGLVAREFDTNGSQRNVQKNRTNKRSGNLASKNVGNK